MATPAETPEVEASATTPTYINRWWRVGGGLSMNMALGTLYAWSVFVAPLEKDFHWTRSQTSTPLPLQSLYSL